MSAANPHTIVVLETGGPVSMPWRDSVQGILEAWYPGIGGAQAMANRLFGAVNPSGKLPVTVEKTEADLPHPQVPGLNAEPKGAAGIAGRRRRNPQDIRRELYRRSQIWRYKWFESEKKEPLFPFGFGLSYTTFVHTRA